MGRKDTQGVTDEEMLLFQQLFRRCIGVYLPVSKKALLHNRLSSRVKALRLPHFLAYYHLVIQPEATAELQIAIDLITTNETAFFREKAHFLFLRNMILPQYGSGSEVALWSAASSTGEEAYSLAMVVDEVIGGDLWTVLGTDINERVLVFAQRALYSIARGNRIPAEYLNTYCLRGTGEYQGNFLINQRLRHRVHFEKMNLLDVAKEMHQKFDVIFLRNVMIYFDEETKGSVVREVIQKLKPDGFLVLGPSETLHGMHDGLEMCHPSIYRRL